MEIADTIKTSYVAFSAHYCDLVAQMMPVSRDLGRLVGTYVMPDHVDFFMDIVRKSNIIGSSASLPGEWINLCIRDPYVALTIESPRFRSRPWYRGSVINILSHTNTQWYIGISNFLECYISDNVSRRIEIAQEIASDFADEYKHCVQAKIDSLRV